MSNIFTAAQCRLSLMVTAGPFSEVLHSNDFQFRFPLIIFNTAEGHIVLLYISP